MPKEKLTITIDQNLRVRLEQQAKEQERSLSNLINLYLRKVLKLTETK